MASSFKVDTLIIRRQSECDHIVISDEQVVGEPRKMTHSSEMEFFWGGLNGKVVAPGTLVICPIDKNRGYHTKN